MITEDMQPWLIEINSSPSMARTTRATAELVDMVLDDTIKGIVIENIF
jgi:tubulin monoglycylase TTLL3/8